MKLKKSSLFSRIAKKNPALKHSVLHFPPNFRNIACCMAKLNSDLGLPEQGNEDDPPSRLPIDRRYAPIIILLYSYVHTYKRTSQYFSVAPLIRFTTLSPLLFGYGEFVYCILLIIVFRFIIAFFLVSHSFYII